MTNEDFTTYTKTDSSGYLTVTAAKVLAADMPREADAWVFKDFGAAHFGDYEHLFTAYLDAGDTGVFGIDMLAANSSTHTIDDMTTNNDGILTRIDQSRLINWDFETDNYDIYNMSLDTPYYCTAKRNSTTHTLKIYSDSERTNLLDTLSITCNITQYRYLHGLTSYSTNSANNVTGYIEDLDLQESPAPTPSGSDFIPNYFDASFVS